MWECFTHIIGLGYLGRVVCFVPIKHVHIIGHYHLWMIWLSNNNLLDVFLPFHSFHLSFFLLKSGESEHRVNSQRQCKAAHWTFSKPELDQFCKNNLLTVPRHYTLCLCSKETNRSSYFRNKCWGTRHWPGPRCQLPWSNMNNAFFSKESSVCFETRTHNGLCSSNNMHCCW